MAIYDPQIEEEEKRRKQLEALRQYASGGNLPLGSPTYDRPLVSLTNQAGTAAPTTPASGGGGRSWTPTVDPARQVQAQRGYDPRFDDPDWGRDDRDDRGREPIQQSGYQPVREPGSYDSTRPLDDRYSPRGDQEERQPNRFIQGLTNAVGPDGWLLSWGHDRPQATEEQIRQSRENVMTEPLEYGPPEKPLLGGVSPDDDYSIMNLNGPMQYWASRWQQENTQRTDRRAEEDRVREQATEMRQYDTYEEYEAAQEEARAQDSGDRGYFPQRDPDSYAQYLLDNGMEAEAQEYLRERREFEEQQQQEFEEAKEEPLYPEWRVQTRRTFEDLLRVTGRLLTPVVSTDLFVSQAQIPDPALEVLFPEIAEADKQAGVIQPWKVQDILMVYGDAFQSVNPFSETYDPSGDFFSPEWFDGLAERTAKSAKELADTKVWLQQLPPEEAALAERANAVGAAVDGGPSGYRDLAEKMVDKDKVVELYRDLANEAFNKGDMVAAAEYGKIANEYDDMTWTEIVDKSTNWGAAFAQGVLLDATNLVSPFAHFADANLGTGFTRAGSARNYWNALASSLTDAEVDTMMKSSAKQAQKVIDDLDDGVAAKGLLRDFWDKVNPFAETADTAAALAADELYQTVGALVSGLNDKNTVKAVLQSIVDGDIMEKFPNIVSRIALGNPDFQKRLATNQVVLSQVIDGLKSLATDGKPFNRARFMSELENASWMKSRELMGIVDDQVNELLSSLPEGTKAVRRATTADGLHFLEYVDKKGNVIGASKEMLPYDAKLLIDQTRKAIAGRRQSQYSLVRVPDQIQRSWLSTVFLNLNPVHWVRNATTAHVFSMTDSNSTFAKTSDIFNWGAKINGGVMPTTDLNEAFRGETGPGMTIEAGGTRNVFNLFGLIGDNVLSDAENAAGRIWAGTTDVGGRVGFGEANMRTRVWYSAAKRYFDNAAKGFRGEFERLFSQGAFDLPEDLARSLGSMVETAMVSGNRNDVINAVREVARTGSWRNALGDFVNPGSVPDAAWPALTDILSRYGDEVVDDMDAYGRFADEVVEWARNASRAFGGDLYTNPVQPGRKVWMDMDTTTEYAFIRDQARKAAKKAGKNPKAYDQDAKQLAEAMAKAEKQARDSLRGELYSMPGADALNVTSEFQRRLEKLQRDLRSGFDAESLRNIYNQNWEDGWQAKRAQYDAYNKKIVQLYNEVLADYKAGKIKPYDAWESVDRFARYSPKYVAQGRLYGQQVQEPLDTPQWQQAIEAGRQQVDIAIDRVTHSMQSFGDQSSLDIMVSMRRDLDRMGAQVDYKLAELRQLLADGNITTQQYYTQRNQLWAEYIDESVLRANVARVEITSSYVAAENGKKLTWVDKETGDGYRLIRHDGDKFIVRNLVTNEVTSMPANRVPEATRNIYDTYLVDTKKLARERAEQAKQAADAQRAEQQARRQAQQARQAQTGQAQRPAPAQLTGPVEQPVVGEEIVDYIDRRSPENVRVAKARVQSRIQTENGEMLLLRLEDGSYKAARVADDVPPPEQATGPVLEIMSDITDESAWVDEVARFFGGEPLARGYLPGDIEITPGPGRVNSPGVLRATEPGTADWVDDIDYTDDEWGRFTFTERFKWREDNPYTLNPNNTHNLSGFEGAPATDDIADIVARQNAGVASHAGAQGPHIGDYSGYLYDQVWDTAESILDNAYDILRTKSVPLTPAQVDTINRIAEMAGRYYQDTAYVASKIGREASEFAMLNFKNRKNFDTVLSMMFAYHYYWSRTPANVLQRMMENPALANFYYEYTDMVEGQNADEPRRFDWTVKNPFHQLAENVFPQAEPFVAERIPDPARLLFPWSLVNEWVDPQEAQNGIERNLLYFQRYTPGLLPLTRLFIDGTMDQLDPIETQDGTEVNRTDEMFPGQYLGWPGRAYAYWRQYKGKEAPEWLIGPYNEGVVGRNIAVGFGEGFQVSDDPNVNLLTAALAVDQLARQEAGEELLPEHEQYAKEIELWLAEGRRRTGIDGLRRTMQGVVTGGMGGVNYPEGEQAARQAKDDLRGMGYSFDNQFGSRTATYEYQDQPFPANEDVSIGDVLDLFNNYFQVYPGMYQGNDDSPAIQAMESIYWKQFFQIMDEMNLAREHAIITSGGAVRPDELYDLNQEYWARVDELKAQYPSLNFDEVEGRAFKSEGGMNPYERAAQKIEQVLSYEPPGKPEWPGEGSSKEEQQAYYAEKGRWDEKQLDYVERIFEQYVVEADAGAPGIGQAVTVDAVMGRYAADMLRAYDLRHARGYEIIWSEQNALQEEWTDQEREAYYQARRDRVAGQMGPEFVGMVDEYLSLPKGQARWDYADANPGVQEALDVYFNPEQHATIVEMFGPDIYDLVDTYPGPRSENPQARDDWEDFLGEENVDRVFAFFAYNREMREQGGQEATGPTFTEAPYFADVEGEMPRPVGSGREPIGGMSREDFLKVMQVTPESIPPELSGVVNGPVLGGEEPDVVRPGVNWLPATVPTELEPYRELMASGQVDPSLVASIMQNAFSAATSSGSGGGTGGGGTTSGGGGGGFSYGRGGGGGGGYYAGAPRVQPYESEIRPMQLESNRTLNYRGIPDLYQRAWNARMLGPEKVEGLRRAAS